MNILRFLLVGFCLFTSTDPLCAQWTQVNAGLTNGYVYALASSGTNLYAATSGGGVFLSTNNGTSWTAVGYPFLDAVAVAVSGSYVFAGTNGNGILVSSNNGTSWSPANVVLPKPYVFGFAVAQNGVGGMNVFAGTYGGGVYLSTDNGGNWKFVNIDHGTLQNWCLVFSPEVGGTGGTNLFAGTTQGVYLSTNNGANWTATSLGYSAHTLAFSSNGSGGSTLFAGTLGNGVWFSSNNGTTWWTAVGNGLTNSSVWSIFVAPPLGGTGGTSVFAGTSGGVFLSTDNGASWMRVNYGLTNINIRAFALSGTNLFVATWGSGVWRRPLSNVTAVERLSTDLPTHFSLDQNYPNPFNPVTTISFAVPSRSFVTLKVFDALGKEVSSLLAEELAAGTYSSRWNAAALPSGIYFYRLQAGSFTGTKKLLLLK